MSDIDAKKALKQHLEMDVFFVGDFAVKGPQCEDQNTQGTDPDIIAGLKEVEMQVKQCLKCELGESRTKAVPGEGNPNARIVFIGEAPGADEDAQGRPFVGRAGKLLDKIIMAMGLRRQDVFIANILKCRPPGNRDPKPDEIVQCVGFLHEQLLLIQPEIIVALGAHAAKTLLDT
jgi:uracil-DNA glycosylase